MGPTPCTPAMLLVMMWGMRGSWVQWFCAMLMAITVLNASQVVTTLEGEDGEDIFSINKGKGKYGDTKTEKDLLQYAIEDRKEARARAEAQMADVSEGASVRRAAGSMANLSGGTSMVYGEFKRATGPRHKIFDKQRKK